MKKLVYIFVPLILLSSLMPTINYSSPAKALEIILESPEASASDLVQSKSIISRRLEAYGISDFEIQVLTDKHQLFITLSDQLAQEPILPLLIAKGELLFCATFNRQEIARMLERSPYRQEWRGWLTVDEENLGGQGNNALLAELEREEISAFISFIEGPDHLIELPGYLHFAFGRFASSEDQIGVYALKYDQDSRILLTGESVKETHIVTNESTGSVSILMEFFPEGKELWAQATRNNMNRSIAIVVDDLVYMAPMVKAEIKEGKAQITGQFSIQEAKTLAAMLQGGALPVEFVLK